MDNGSQLLGPGGMATNCAGGAIVKPLPSQPIRCRDSRAGDKSRPGFGSSAPAGQGRSEPNLMASSCVALTWRERSLSGGVKGERPSLLPRLAEAHRDLARAPPVDHERRVREASRRHLKSARRELQCIDANGLQV